MTVKDSFFDQPYSDRQLVLFVDDASIVASEKVAATKAPSIATNLFDQFNRQPTWVKGTAGAAALLLSPYVGGAFLATLLVVRAVEMLQKKEGVENLKLVGKSKLGLFQLPPGHPRNRVVYVGHPCIPNKYVPFADFHRLTFEHKFSEVISLLIHLGAKTIRVERTAGWGAEFTSRLAVDLPVAGSETKQGIEVGSKSHGQRTALFCATLDNRHGCPASLPIDDLVWYPFEPTWQQIAESRLNFGLKQFTLSLSYNEDFGINANLKLKVEKAGLDIGGTYEKFSATTWSIFGDFWDSGSERDAGKQTVKSDTACALPSGQSI